LEGFLYFSEPEPNGTVPFVTIDFFILGGRFEGPFVVSFINCTSRRRKGFAAAATAAPTLPEQLVERVRITADERTQRDQ